MKRTCATISAICSICTAATVARADGPAETMVRLGRQSVAIGPADTTVLHRLLAHVGAHHYALVATADETMAGACPIERVASWEETEGQWLEVFNEPFPVCPPAPGATTHVRAAFNPVGQPGVGYETRRGGAITMAPSRFFPRGETRFVDASRRNPAVLAAVSSDPVTTTIAPTPAGLAVDGDLREWATTTPTSQNDEGQLWITQRGDALVIAG